jgi:two-component system, NarL family, invasion response regulator UvrY
MRVFLLDDQAHVRAALRKLLKHRPNMQVVGEAVDTCNLWVEVEAARPDLLLSDWSALGSCPGEMLTVLHARYPQLPVIIMSGQPEVRRAALAAGADAFISKTDPPDQLLAALKQVCHDPSYQV